MVFFINIPVGAILIIASLLYLPKDLEFKKLKFNFISLFWISVATIALLIMLSKGQQRGWFNDSLIGILLFTTIVGYLFYILSEINSKHTLIDFSLFKNSNFTNGILIYFFIMGFSMYQYFYLIPVYYEHIKMLPTLDAGIAVFTFALFIGLFSPVAGIMSDKIGAKNVILIATIIYISTTLFLLPNLNYYTPLVKAELLTIPFGIGMGLFFAPVTVLLLQNAPQQKGELAIVLMDYARFVGGSFGTALATNNMEYFKNLNFLHMNELQYYSFIDWYLALFQKLTNITKEQAQAAFGNYETFMSYNFGFAQVYMNAAYWGLVGAVFVLLLYVRYKPLRIEF
jgi:DHA2 family multidrug resistance protein